MLPSAARPRSTKVEVCDPDRGDVEPHRCRAPHDRAEVDRRGRRAGPRVAGAGGGAPAAAGAGARPGRAGRGRGGRGSAGAAAAAAAAAGWGGPWCLRPRVEHDPGDENQHDGGRRGEQRLRGGHRAGRAGPSAPGAGATRRPGARAGGHEQQAAAEGDQAGVVRARGAAGAGGRAAGGRAARAPQRAGSVASVGRLGSRSLLVSPSYLPSWLWSTPWMTTTDWPLAMALATSRGDLDAAALVGDLAAGGGVEAVDGQARLRGSCRRSWSARRRCRRRRGRPRWC